MHECQVSDMDIIGNLLVCRVCGKHLDITPHVCKKERLLARYKKQGVHVVQCTVCDQYWFMRRVYDEYSGDPYDEWEDITPEQAQEYIIRIKEYGGEVYE